MSSIAFVFPGQGSQAPGMGKSLHETFPESRLVFEEASDTLGFSMEKLCFEADETELKKTENTQPALLTVSTAALRALEARGITAAACAGHSVGEYGALVGAGILPFAAALRLVRERGLLMANADPEGKGGMAAVIGLENEQVDKLLADAAAFGTLEAANFNSPGQVVISGEKSAIAQAEALAMDAGAKMYIALEVSGAFHSSFMQPAAERFRAALAGAPFAAGRAKVVSNVTAGWTDPGEQVELLVRQIHSPVRWEESVRFLAKEGFSTFVEVGSGKVLSGLFKRIDRTLKVLATGDAAGIENVSKELGGA